ncbi:MAG TPA: isoprenyl transferase [Candidatus Omnitrophota bacterium]|nr:isoprenyl transferase [Candidatus Omnitrophota bacterium]
MIDTTRIPKHIAFIMDGNGRWAKERGLPRTAGHAQGVERVKEMVRAASDIGVQVMTFYAFSTENWTRPKQEIDILMYFLEGFLEKEVEELHKNNVRFRVIGKGDPIPKRLQDLIRRAEEKTKNNSRMTAILALNYGSRQEIVDAARRFAGAVERGDEKPDAMTVERFSQYLYTVGLPDPDLLIRTSGEMRISNFLLWQLSYAELYFPKKYWPDFHKEDLLQAIEEFQQRERRFGNVDTTEKNN